MHVTLIAAAILLPKKSDAQTAGGGVDWIGLRQPRQVSSPAGQHRGHRRIR
jgi:hypothetical protein